MAPRRGQQLDKNWYRRLWSDFFGWKYGQRNSVRQCYVIGYVFQRLNRRGEQHETATAVRAGRTREKDANDDGAIGDRNLAEMPS